MTIFKLAVPRTESNLMRALNLITLLLIVTGGVDWLLVGLFQFDLIASLFGGQDNAFARLVYILVGLSAIYQFVPLSRALSIAEAPAEVDRHH